MFLSMVNNDQKLGPLGRGIYEARLDGNLGTILNFRSKS